MPLPLTPRYAQFTGQSSPLSVRASTYYCTSVSVGFHLSVCDVCISDYASRFSFTPAPLKGRIRIGHDADPGQVDVMNGIILQV